MTTSAATAIPTPSIHLFHTGRTGRAGLPGCINGRTRKVRLFGISLRAVNSIPQRAFRAPVPTPRIRQNGH